MSPALEPLKFQSWQEESTEAGICGMKYRRVFTPSREMAVTGGRGHALSLELGPSLIFKSEYLLRRKSPWKPPAATAHGYRCGCLDFVSRTGKELLLLSASTCLHSWPWRLLLVPLGVKGLYLPVTVARPCLSFPLRSAANLGLLSSQTKRGLLKCSVP